MFLGVFNCSHIWSACIFDTSYGPWVWQLVQLGIPINLNYSSRAHDHYDLVLHLTLQGSNVLKVQDHWCITVSKQRVCNALHQETQKLFSQTWSVCIYQCSFGLKVLVASVLDCQFTIEQVFDFYDQTKWELDWKVYWSTCQSKER